jgi:hypothetical protein
VRDADWEEVRAPVARRVGGELHVPALVRHAGDDQAETGPGVEPLMDQVQLARTVAHEHGGEGVAEAAATGAEFHQPLFDDLICPQQQRRRDRQAERFGGLEVDDELELRRLLDGHIGGLSPFQNLSDK